MLDGSEWMLENADSMLVRISATLMGIHSEQDSRVLEMNADGHLFLARMPDTKESVSLRIGSQLALTGVYVGKSLTWSEGGKPSGFELLLSSPSQLTVLSQPSWWTPRRLLVTVGLLLVILTLAAVWISQLRRLVEQRTRQLQQEIREREVAERERALETERSRIARDLHDDLGSSLTEIGVLASKGQRSGALEELAALFRGIAAKARGLVTALDVIVWAVDPKDNSLESVADYLSDFASEYLSHSGITCRFDIPVALPAIVLDGRLRHGLLLAVKETLNNVERHAQATEVEFRMAFAEDQLQIIISDNGKGFDTKTKHSGQRLEEPSASTVQTRREISVSSLRWEGGRLLPSDYAFHRRRKRRLRASHPDMTFSIYNLGRERYRVQPIDGVSMTTGARHNSSMVGASRCDARTARRAVPTSEMKNFVLDPMTTTNLEYGC